METKHNGVRYTGPVKAAVLDWSGTLVDKYVIAPAESFVQIFKRAKVPITMEEAREPMGMRKDLHIKTITEMPQVAERWKEHYGRLPNDEDVQKMYKDFVPITLGSLAKYSGLIDGCEEAINILKKKYNMKIGVTTGFTKEMVDVILAEVKKQGLVPDASVAGDEVQNGDRPKPFMLYRNLELMDIHPIQAVVKVDDTISGIGEAQNAGCWSVGVARWSNYMYIDSYEHEAKLTEADIEARLEKSRTRLQEAGAHYVVDSVADLPQVVEDINRRMACGESPY